jgi:hypothetical protein
MDLTNGNFFQTPELRVYAEYIDNFKNSVSTVQKCQQDEKFRNFLEEVREKKNEKPTNSQWIFCSLLYFFFRI